MAYTENKEPTGLTALTSLDAADVFIVGDASDANEVAKKITKTNLVTDLGSSFATAAHTHEGTAILSTGEVGGTKFLREDGDNTSSWQAVPAPEGTAVKSTGEAGGVKFLREDGDGTCSWQSIAAGGDVSKVGTPANNQVGVWTGDGTIEGDAALTFDTATDRLSTTTSGIVETGSIELGHASDTTITRTGAGAIAVEGTAVLLSGGALGTPSSGTLTNCSGLPLSGVTDSTSEALGVGTLELGHASDTTIARSGAGAVTIEGVTVVTTSNTVTLSNKSISGALTLEENASIALDPAGSADGKYSGITITGTAGATLAFGDLIYLDPTDSRWELADANAAAAADGDARGVLGICVLAAAADGNATTILLHGVVRADTAFPTFTIGGQVYVSETAGDVTQTQPTTTDVVIRVVGVAITADEMFFNPSPDYITHT